MSDEQTPTRTKGNPKRHDKRRHLRVKDRWHNALRGATSLKAWARENTSIPEVKAWLDGK